MTDPLAAGPVRDRRAFAAAALALAVLFAGNNLPSALYGAFRTAFGYSPLTQTLLYAVPVVAVILPGMLVFGPLSDLTGRRALVLSGLAVFAVGDALFAAATSTGWLFAARLAQGLGMAVLTAAAAATLSDSAGGFIAGREAAQRAAALASTLGITGGLAAGPLIGGILAQYAPDRLRLPFLAHLALVVATMAAVVSLPGKPPGTDGRFRPAQLKIPAALRRSFPVIAVSEFLAWGVVGVFSAVIPALIGQILRTGNLALTAGGLTLMIGASAAAQVAAPRLRPATALLAGLTTLTAGLSLLIAASSLRAAALVVLAMLASGVGHGLVFAGNLTKVTVDTPAGERGSVLSTVYFVNYAGLGVPVIGVGILALSTGLLSATRVAAVVFAAGCVLLLPFVSRAFDAQPARRALSTSDR
jgi:predicted MFS family arabinose efflux permease